VLDSWKVSLKWIGGALVLTIAVSAFLQFQGLERRPPERAPGPGPGPGPSPAPIIDPELADKYREEPTISMFDHATGKVLWMPLETYVEGIVAAEIGNRSPLAATEAQAIASRTVVMTILEEGTGEARRLHGTDACTSPQHPPPYRPDFINDRVREAVRNSRGQVITHDAQFIVAFYYSCSGGRTASYEESFPGNIQPPYIKVVNSPCVEGEEWEAEVPKGRLRQVAGWTMAGPIDRVKVLETGPSGRATKVQVGDTTVHGVDLRNGLGRGLVKSTLFTSIRIVGDTVVFRGRGYGHGVGFDQKGSRKLAENGMDAKALINYYYKDVNIAQLWK